MWRHWVTIALAFCSQTARAQYKLDHNCAVNRQLALNKAAVPVADAGVQFVPECTASGIDYQPLQCLAWDFCACSSAEGRMLTNWTRGLEGCDCLVAQDKSRQVGSFVPQCDSMDRFAELQCNEQNGRCWRVDPQTGLVVHPKKRYPTNQPIVPPPHVRAHEPAEVLRKREPLPPTINNSISSSINRPHVEPKVRDHVPPYRRVRPPVNVMLSNGTMLGTAMPLNATLVILKQGDLDRFMAPLLEKCVQTREPEVMPLLGSGTDVNGAPVNTGE